MLTGFDLTFMGVTRSNSCLFSIPVFLVSPVGKRGIGAKKKSEREKKGRRKKGNRKEKEGRE